MTDWKTMTINSHKREIVWFFTHLIMTLLVSLKTIWETTPFVHFIKSYGGDVHRHCGKWPETVSSMNVLFKGQRLNEGYHVTLSYFH